MEPLTLWMLMHGRVELGLLVEQGCFDLAASNVVVGFPEPAQDACLTLDELGKRWGVVFSQHDSESVIKVTKGAKRLPAVQDTLRRDTWAKLGYRSPPEDVRAATPAVRTRPAMTLRGTVDTSRDQGTQAVGLRTALGPGTWSLDMVDTTDEGLTRVRTSWHSSGPAHDLRVGDVALQNNHLTNYHQGRGVTLEVGRRGRRSLAWSRDIQGERPGDDWTSELYVNGRLVDYADAGSTSWAFEDVPQPGTITIKHYGPTGEVEEQTLGARGGSLLPPGRVRSSLQLLQDNDPLLGPGAAPDDPQAGDLAMRAGVEVGIAPALTATASRRHLPGGHRLTSLGALVGAGDLLVEAEAVEDGQGNYASLSSARLGGLYLEHEHRAEGFHAERRRGLERRTRADYRQAFGPVHLSPGITHEAWHTGRETWDLDLDTRVYGGRTSYNANTSIRHDDNSGWGPFKVRGSARWRGETGRELLLGGQTAMAGLTASSLHGSLRLPLTSSDSFRLAGSATPADGRWSLTPSVTSKDVDGWRASLAVPVSSDAGPGVMLTFSTSVTFDDAWEPRVDPRGAKQLVSVRVYVDMDEDGRYSAGDDPVPGVPVRQVGTTGRDGIASAWMSPGREIIIDLGVDELTDPRHYGTGPLAFTARPGSWTTVDYRVRFVPI